MARQQTISSSTVIYDADKDGRCHGFWVGVHSSSANGADVFVEGIHDADSPFPLEIDQAQNFGPNSISKVTVIPTSGNSIISYGVTQK